MGARLLPLPASCERFYPYLARPLSTNAAPFHFPQPKLPATVSREMLWKSKSKSGKQRCFWWHYPSDFRMYWPTLCADCFGAWKPSLRVGFVPIDHITISDQRGQSAALMFWIAVVGEDSPTVGYCGSGPSFTSAWLHGPKKGVRQDGGSWEALGKVAGHRGWWCCSSNHCRWSRMIMS